MSLYLYNGVLLKAGSALATNANCCCNQNKCCLLGECFDNISDEFCTAMGGYIDTGACGPFDGTTPTTGACVCNPSTEVEDRVDCCIDGEIFYSGTGDYPDLILSECDCLAVGGTVYTGDPCTNEGCDFGDETASADGIVCLPDGTCLTVCSGCDLETVGQVCLYTYIGGVFTAGGTCPDDCTGAVDPETNDLNCPEGQKCLCHQMVITFSTGSSYCPATLACQAIREKALVESWSSPGTCKRFKYTQSTGLSGFDCGSVVGTKWVMCVTKCQCVANSTTCPYGSSKSWTYSTGGCTTASSTNNPISVCAHPTGVCP